MSDFVLDIPKECLYDRERLIASGIVDIAFPECDSEGNYKKVQCSYAWGLQCWCADRNGNAYWNTTVYNNAPDCTEEGIAFLRYFFHTIIYSTVFLTVLLHLFLML